MEVIGGTEYEFGTMMHGETQSHDFLVRNVGDGPLVLEKAGSTCKCTVGKMEKSVLAPGEETIVNLTWTAQSVLPVYGQSATFTTTDPSQSELKFSVTGMIADSFVIEPNELALGDVPVTEGGEKVFYVFTYLKDSQNITNLRWSNPQTQPLVEITSEVVPATDTPYAQHKSALVAHRVAVKLKPGLPLGPLTSWIQFETDREDKVGMLEVHVNGRVTSDISIVGGASFDPEMSLITLGNIKSSQGASVGVFLSIQGEDRERIVPRIDSWEPAESMQVSLGEAKVSGNRTLIPVLVEIPKGAPPAYFPGNASGKTGKIVIKTNHETIREIPIYVRLVVEE